MFDFESTADKVMRHYKVLTVVALAGVLVECLNLAKGLVFRLVLVLAVCLVLVAAAILAVVVLVQKEDIGVEAEVRKADIEVEVLVL